MKGDDKVLKVLNEALANELGAIIQWRTHAEMFKFWGFSKLAAYELDIAGDEEKHRDWLIARILFLEGVPTVEPGPRLIGCDVIEMLKLDIKGEKTGIDTLVAGIKLAEEKCDFVTRDLFVKILQEETEDHTQWLETQLNLINLLGVENYLQAQM